MRSLSQTEANLVSGASYVVGDVYTIEQWRYMEQGARKEAEMAAVFFGGLAAYTTYAATGFFALPCFLPTIGIGLLAAESAYIYEYRNSELLPYNQ